MRRSFHGLAALALSAVPAAAETQAQVVYSHKAWEVQAVSFDDGTSSCVASVTEPGDSFSIWAGPDNPVKLQFYSTDWQFDGGSANLQIRIDRRAPWNLTNAELYQNSVLFNLPDSNAGTNFLLEVARGNVLYLRTETGDPVKSYTLSGSRASISALIDCATALEKGMSPSNPFR